MQIGICAGMLLNSDFTGIEHYINNLAEQLLKNKEHGVKLILSSDIFLEHFPEPSLFKHDPLFIKLSRFFSSLRSYSKGLSGFDVVHAPTVTAPFFFRPSGVKVVMTVHDLIPNLFPQWQPLKRRVYFKHVLKHRFRYVDRFIAVSKSTRNDLIRLFNIDKDKIDIVYEGVSERFKPPKNNNRGNYILGVSTLEPKKNFRKLIKAYILLKEKHNIIEKLVITGKEGWFFKEIIDIPAKYKTDIIFKGYVSNEKLVEMYQKAKIFVYPSMYEGFGLPVIEAMACGCPVITSNVSSLPEVAGSAAYYVNPYRVEDIERGLNFLLNDKSLRDEFSQKGLRQSRKFSWQTCAEETIKVYEAACS